MTHHKLFRTRLFPFLILSLALAGFVIHAYQEPKIPLDSYTIEDGFELKCIASEPFLKAPVGMSFDDKGRMWVVEMVGYMPNLEGIGEEEPNGRVSILEDLDGNGIVDHAKVFLDKLVLPRSIAHVYGGLLYTDGIQLCFVEIKNDKPRKKIVVDPIYAEGGNVEHNSNGLMMNIDNWIYNANYNFRYQRKNGKWIKEPTTYRGQWGITKDNFGRLYFNDNSTNLKGDYVLPNKVIRNKYFKPTASENQRLASNQVFPAHATSVNRGYIQGILDEKGQLKEVTSACGPLVYRGGAFPAAYNQNAFVCVPEANLIKRNILDFTNLQTKANQAIEGKEFITSTDEGFRPVNIFNAPDGAMYVVDMHRGIIQHKAYISQYLTEELGKKQLDTLQNAGRILKITHKTTPLTPLPTISKATSKELIGWLSSPNGWLRDRAQQLLIEHKDKSITKEVAALTTVDNAFATSIHALYVLEGRNALTFETLTTVISQSKNPQTIAHALGLLEQFAALTHVEKMKAVCSQLLAQNNETIDLYLPLSLSAWLTVSEASFLPILVGIDKKYPTQKLFQEAITSSLEGKEETYLNTMNPSSSLKNNLTATLNNHQKKEMNSIFVKQKNVVDDRTKGLQLFRSICGTCHGADGKGIQDLAPPLKNSEYIDGSIHRLTAIALHGLSGPITVDGKLYQLSNDMPGLANNPSLSDADIADIINFTQNAFAKQGKRVSADEVKKLRQKKPADGGLFTEKLLFETAFDR